MLLKHFNASWVEIEEVMPLFDLRAGYDSLHLDLKGEPSKYHMAITSPAAPPRAATVAEDINDSLPEHSADIVPIKPNAAEEPATPKTIKDRLLADIPSLSNVTDCLKWGLAMHDTFETLSKKDKETVQNALIAKQATFLNGHAHI
jgi:hypothetical protein